MKAHSKCYACGGSVDAEGMAMGGEVEQPEAPDDAVNAEPPSTQMQGAQEATRLAQRRFVAAVRSRR